MAKSRRLRGRIRLTKEEKRFAGMALSDEFWETIQAEVDDTEREERCPAGICKRSAGHTGPHRDVTDG